MKFYGKFLSYDECFELWDEYKKDEIDYFYFESGISKESILAYENVDYAHTLLELRHNEFIERNFSVPEGYYNREIGYDLMLEVKNKQEFYDHNESGDYESELYFLKELKPIEDAQIKDTDWTEVEDIIEGNYKEVYIPLWKSTSDRITELLNIKKD